MNKNEQNDKFISVYQTYVDEIYQFIYLRTGMNPTVAEDITQDIFVKVFKGLAGFHGLSSMRTWVFEVARNCLNDYYREQYQPLLTCSTIDDLHEDELEDPRQDVGDLEINHFEQQRVRECLLSLQQQYRVILILKYMDDRSVKEIAAFCRKTPKAIESLLTRARGQFIKTYQQMSEGDDSR